VPGLGRNIIYAIAEDKSQRLLVASASGFYVAPRQSGRNWKNRSFTRVETGSGAPDTTGSVRAIIQFRGATYFAIYGRGIDRMDGGRSSLTWPNTAPPRVKFSVCSPMAKNDSDRNYARRRVRLRRKNDS
jgi:hypothetical protein